MRLVGENVEPKVYSYDRAMALADEHNLDLVEISPHAEPPVCRIFAYQNFFYQQQKPHNDLKS